MIGVLGIIGGLVFLGFELRQNNALLQSEASVAYVNMRVDGIRSHAQDADLRATIVKAREGRELTPEESLSLDLYYYSIFVNWEWEYAQYREGTLDVLNQPPELRWRPALDEYPLIREKWISRKRQMSAEFVQFMEEEVLN